ncbi:MAG: hypothetical protein CAPSK01_001048 [Candidatus Accumulibacter vicinus]|uniref:Uncharacterized protein n=1 Tax=Candidatus Accumulibacter vicinus TaxID=2954382 RepID=A0A084Y3K8_9PROT|nr:MAG: hypothetical protein CAPSK01_001048 [Candidatus Accumulibacter vicinus]
MTIQAATARIVVRARQVRLESRPALSADARLPGRATTVRPACRVPAEACSRPCRSLVTDQAAMAPIRRLVGSGWWARKSLLDSMPVAARVATHSAMAGDHQRSQASTPIGAYIKATDTRLIRAACSVV